VLAVAFLTTFSKAVSATAAFEAQQPPIDDLALFALPPLVLALPTLALEGSGDFDEVFELITG